MMRAVCAAVLNSGYESFIRRVFPHRPPAAILDKLFEDLQERAAEYFRGEVWPLKHSFGVLARFVNGVVGVSSKERSPSVVKTWESESWFISCSCVGRTSHAAWLRRAPKDATCVHSRVFSDTLSRLARRLGVPTSVMRSSAPAPLSEDSLPGPSTSSRAPCPEDWDAERPIDTFRVDQTTVAVVASRSGPCRVIAAVRCTRSVTSCAFCDSAAGFSCVHALRSRRVRRQDPAAAGDGGFKSEDEVDGARSSLPLPVFKCAQSVRANTRACAAMEQGEVFFIAAPSVCPKCSAKKAECSTQKDAGTIMCTTGHANMEIESFWCNNKDCEIRVFPNGKEAGVVIWSSITAATAVVMRDFAREMTTNGTPLNSCYPTCFNRYVDVRDSGAFPAMAETKGKTRQTVTSMFFFTMQLIMSTLMVKDPPIWTFRCSDRQDKDGRFRVITADGIWLGFLTRLASGQYTNPTEECSSVKETVEVAALHPSEWVRRFLRTALKQPSEPVVVKNGQLRSATCALAFL